MKRDPDPRHDGAPAFRWRIRVYWEDTDAGGVVYHAAYVRFLERARTEWMRASGLGQQQVRETFDVVFVVRELDIAYDKPARLDDELDATVHVVRRRAASFELAQDVVRVADRVTLARARLRIACVGAATFAPTPIPPGIAGLIEGSDPA